MRDTTVAAHPTPTNADPGALTSSLITNLNLAIAHYPVESIISLAMLEGVSFTVTKSLMTAFDIHLPTLFLVAYVISTPIRRSMISKLVLAVPMGTVLSWLAPPLTKVHLSNIWKGWERPRWMERFNRKKEGAIAEHASAKPKSALASRLESLSDRYGLALLISYRLAACLIVNGVYFALLNGLDITPLLSYFGITTDVHQVSAMSSYAGAVVYGALWFPLTVLLAPYPARLINIVRRKLTGKKASKDNTIVSANMNSASSPMNKSKQ